MVKEINQKGQFTRQGTHFNALFGNEANQLPVEAGRYRLIWSPVCPWAHRVVIARRILGLESAISLGTADPLRPKIDRVDWAFTLDEGDVDPVLGIRYLSEIYLETDPFYEGRPTVPVIVDTKQRKVVQNNYFRLTNELETAWKELHKEDAPELYPPTLREAIDELNDVIFHDVNNGVYKCGFARSQQAYDEAFDILFARLDELDQRLEKNRFLFGNYITDSDIRLYVTLVRFDIAYYSAFKANKKQIRDYPNLSNYLRDLYQTPGFGDTTDIDAIKIHYFLSNHLATDDVKSGPILPKGPDIDWLLEGHNREKLSKTTEKFLISKHSEIVIRDAQLGDYEAVKSVRWQANRVHEVKMTPEHWQGLSRSFNEDFLNVEGVQTIVAELNGEIVGSAVLFPAEAAPYKDLYEIGYPELRLLSVSPVYQGHGIAKKLIHETIERTRKQGYNTIGLHTSDFMDVAVHIYENLGFEREPALDFKPIPEEDVVVKAYRLTI